MRVRWRERERESERERERSVLERVPTLPTRKLLYLHWMSKLLNLNLDNLDN